MQLDTKKRNHKIMFFFWLLFCVVLMFPPHPPSLQYHICLKIVGEEILVEMVGATLNEGGYSA